MDVGSAAVEVTETVERPLLLEKDSFFGPLTVIEVGVAKLGRLERVDMLSRSSLGIWNWNGKGVCTVTTGVRLTFSVSLFITPFTVAEALLAMVGESVTPCPLLLATRVLSISPSLVALPSRSPFWRLGLARGCNWEAVGSLDRVDAGSSLSEGGLWMMWLSSSENWG